VALVGNSGVDMIRKYTSANKGLAAAEQVGCCMSRVLQRSSHPCIQVGWASAIQAAFTIYSLTQAEWTLVFSSRVSVIFGCTVLTRSFGRLARFFSSVRDSAPC